MKLSHAEETKLADAIAPKCLGFHFGSDSKKVVLTQKELREAGEAVARRAVHLTLVMLGNIMEGEKGHG